MNKWLSIGVTPPAILAQINAPPPMPELSKAGECTVRKYKPRGAKTQIFDYQTILAKLAMVYPDGFTVQELCINYDPTILWSQLLKRIRELCPAVLIVLRSESRGATGGRMYVYKVIPEEIPTLIKAQHDRKVAAEAARHRNFRRNA